MRKSNPNNTTRYSKWIFAIIITIIMALSVAYASFSATARMENIMAEVRPQADVKVTSVSVSSSSSNGISNSENYNIDRIYGSLTLPAADSSVTYKVDVTVFLSSEMKIVGITGLNNNLEYELTDYTLGDILCDTNNECSLGATDEFYITIRYKENGYDSNNTTYSFQMIFEYAEVNYVARIGTNHYESLQDAIDDVSTNNIETTIVLLKNTSEALTVAANKNIKFNLQTNTLSNDGVAPVIYNYGTIKIYNGTITSDTTQGAINNETGATLYMSGGNIIATGTKQAIYNNGGTATITGTAYLSSTSSQRATVHNLNSGHLTITGGTIISTGYSAVVNVATLTIGIEDGEINRTTPIIQGKTYGVENTATFNFYDGILRGKTAAISNEALVTDIETGYEILHETARIEGSTYHTARLAIFATVTFNANGGSTDPSYKEVEVGNAIGEMPTPTRTDYEFDGWFTTASGGTEITENQMITADIEYFAHWTHISAVVVASINNTNYQTIQAAINAVPTNNTETTITILRNTSELLSIAANQNIVLNIQNRRISNNGNNPVIRNRGTLRISNGEIYSTANQGAINNERGGNLLINGGQINATGPRQALYNDGGTAVITGSAYLSSTTSERGAVQNLNSGHLTITGGTIVSTGYSAVVNTANLTIGTKDGTISTSTPVIQGKIYGVDNSSTFNFYDGILKGRTAAINGSVADLETNSSIITATEIIENQTYQTAHLSQ